MAAGTLDNPSSKPISPGRFAHVVLRTNKFDAMRAFYKTFLGAHATYEDDVLAFLTYDQEHHRIGLVNMPDLSAKDRSTAGLEHLAFTFDSLHDLALAYLQRKENGILPFWPVNHGPTTSIYYHDPDGNILETQVENFETNKEVMAFMKSEAYRTNPIGVDFDVEEFVRKVKAGEDPAKIKERPNIGPRGIDSVPE